MVVDKVGGSLCNFKIAPSVGSQTTTFARQTLILTVLLIVTDARVCQYPSRLRAVTDYLPSTTNAF